MPLTLPAGAVFAGQGVPVALKGRPGSTVELRGYSRPSTSYHLLRTATVGADGRVVWTLRPMTNTRVYAVQHGCAAGPSAVVLVRSVMTLNARPAGLRRYTFSGTSLPGRPAGQVVELNATSPSGRRLLLGRVRTDERGRWTLTVTLPSTGRYLVRARSAGDMVNAAGGSRLIRVG
jgi:hypothetical protein